MTDALRSKLWSILSATFQSVSRRVQTTIPAVTVTRGYSHNDAFPFRAYTEFVNVDRVVVISFDIESRGSQIHSFGDISLETGAIVETLLSIIDEASPRNDAVLISHANEFSERTLERAEQLAETLRTSGGTDAERCQGKRR